MVKVTQHAFIGENLVTRIRPKKRGSAFNARRSRLAGRVYHLGAGRQSSYLIERMLDGELPRADIVVFADTGDEPYWVYKQVEYLKARCEEQGIRLVIVRRPGRGLVYDIQHNLDQRFASLPLYTRGDDGKIGRMRRQCTSEYKIKPSENLILTWLVEHGHAQVVIDKNGKASRRVRSDVYTENYYGISFEEFWRAGNRGAGWQKAIYPMIDERKTADAVEWLQAHHRPVPKKSACRICPFHDDDYWLWMQTEEPADFEHACQFDEWLRSPEAKNRKQLKGLRQDVYLHRTCQPLRSIDFAVLAAEKQRTGTAPLMELCGDFCMT
jgi:hypothetical protein